MIIDNINLNHLRIFECVYRTRSMTKAAKELHLTQSGVSQHMKSLEDVLELKLFDRVKQRLIPTSASSALFKRCAEALYSIEHTLTDIREGQEHVTGTVAIGMPHEFGNNMIMPLLAKFCKKHPFVKFALKYGFPNEMNDGILKGDLDFAFVDGFGLDKRIATQKVYDEILHLCATPDFVKAKGAVRENRGYFESLEYVDYQQGEPVLRMWFDHHLDSGKINLNVRSTLMDVQGIARLITNHLAAGILPGHLVTSFEKDGRKLHKFKGCGKPLKNSISVAFLKERTSSPAVSTVLAWLLEQLKTEGSLSHGSRS